MISSCQLCGSIDTPLEILDLGEQPICNALLASEALKEPEQYYPLKLTVCKECYLVSLSEVIPASTVFGESYNYLTGTTEQLVQYFKALADNIIERYALKRTDTVCDIGSNDGTFLRFFKRRNINVIGVEPAPLPTKIATKSGIPTIQEFFTEKTAERLAKTVGKVKIITAMNVLAHTDNIHSFLKGVRTLMIDDSVFISQSHYLPLLMERLEYDTIYHEHLRYYTLSALKKLFDMHGFHIFDAQINEFYGGSILVHSSVKDIKPTVDAMNILDSETKYRNLETYTKFEKFVKKKAKELLDLLLNLKKAGKRIVGVGAPMKSSTLLNYLRVGPDILDYLTEVNPLKIGKYLPGVHIPIVHESQLFHSQPDYALILPWNIANQVIEALRKKGYAGKFIIPIPQPKILE